MGSAVGIVWKLPPQGAEMEPLIVAGLLLSYKGAAV